MVFGKLSEFAKTLTKGARVQVEGELRPEYESKKTNSKQRLWEIRVFSILSLIAPKDPLRKIRITMTRLRRKRPHEARILIFGSPVK